MQHGKQRYQGDRGASCSLKRDQRHPEPPAHLPRCLRVFSLRKCILCFGAGVVHLALKWYFGKSRSLLDVCVSVTSDKGAGKEMNSLGPGGEPGPSLFPSCYDPT